MIFEHNFTDTRDKKEFEDVKKVEIVAYYYTFKICSLLLLIGFIWIGLKKKSSRINLIILIGNFT